MNEFHCSWNKLNKLILIGGRGREKEPKRIVKDGKTRIIAILSFIGLDLFSFHFDLPFSNRIQCDLMCVCGDTPLMVAWIQSLCAHAPTLYEKSILISMAIIRCFFWWISWVANLHRFGFKILSSNGRRRNVTFDVKKVDSNRMHDKNNSFYLSAAELRWKRKIEETEQWIQHKHFLFIFYWITFI